MSGQELEGCRKIRLRLRDVQLWCRRRRKVQLVLALTWRFQVHLEPVTDYSRRRFCPKGVPNFGFGKRLFSKVAFLDVGNDSRPLIPNEGAGLRSWDLQLMSPVNRKRPFCPYASPKSGACLSQLNFAYGLLHARVYHLIMGVDHGVDRARTSRTFSSAVMALALKPCSITNAVVAPTSRQPPICGLASQGGFAILELRVRGLNMDVMSSIRLSRVASLHPSCVSHAGAPSPLNSRRPLCCTRTRSMKRSRNSPIDSSLRWIQHSHDPVRSHLPHTCQQRNSTPQLASPRGRWIGRGREGW